MPEAFEHIPAQRDAPIFIFGDHASRHIPRKFKGLGLSGDDLTRHIAWDIGTDGVVRRLCAHFGGPGQLAGVSRLVIDVNRDAAMDSLIPEDSDGSLIPGNQNLTPAQRRERIAQFYDPYHAEISRQLDRLADPLVLSIHSFTPHPKNGEQRLTDIGLLVKHDVESAEQLRRGFARMERKFNVGINVPYSAYDLNHTMDVHVGPRGLRHLAIEIRQDLIDSEAGIADISNVLIERLEPLINRPHITLTD